METIEYKGTFEQYLCEKATVNNIPINAILELTPMCNMNCNMCFARLTSEETKQKGGIWSTEEWIALGKELQKAGTMFVLLTGGEPLLYQGFKDVYLALRQMGMILTVNTNGTLIDEKWADFFALYPPRRINITLYGKDRTTYENLCHYPNGYTKTMKAIELLKKRNIDIKINGSITPDNVDDIDELVTIVRNFDVAWKFDTYMYPACKQKNSVFRSDSRLTAEQAAAARALIMKKKMDKETFSRFIDKFVSKGRVEADKYEPMPINCRAGRSSFLVDWQGIMRPCVMMSEPSVPVITREFETTWKKLVKTTAEIRMSAECSACVHREICQTCAACAFWESGSFEGVPEYMCRYTKETLRILREEWEKKENEQDISDR